MLIDSASRADQRGGPSAAPLARDLDDRQRAAAWAVHGPHRAPPLPRSTRRSSQPRKPRWERTMRLPFAYI
jgi:hypothetical protein